MASIMEDHHFPGELWGVRLRSPTACRIHTERRLHQMLQQFKDYDIGPPPLPIEGDQLSLATTIMEANKRFGYGNASNRVVSKPQVSIESWRERDYLVVNVSSSDRPKLMFDSVCTLTDLDYDVFHGSINTDGSVAIQEYFVRHMNKCTLLNEIERQSLVRSLAAAVERRMSQGLKVEVRSLNHQGLLSNMRRVLR
ncbi:ACT domain-containing protein ACR4-like, partial [Dendrobium catenatum]|uniref:ACT domain-containing protein ACR4-like n=1 Tax=Dendrobium catenatum TaxID=906689 RepID=UPI0010A04D2E